VDVLLESTNLGMGSWSKDFSQVESDEAQNIFK
jgi:hypothetical protein